MEIRLFRFFSSGVSSEKLYFQDIMKRRTPLTIANNKGDKCIGTNLTNNMQDLDEKDFLRDS